MIYITGKTFRPQDYPAAGLEKAEYDSCTFTGVPMSGAGLSGSVFSECVFEHCDLSMAVIKGTVFRDVVFKGCKMLGLRFDQCNTFLVSFRFEQCMLNFSVFHSLKIKQTVFNECKLEDADFSQADLTRASFAGSDLLRAVFDGSNLTQADLRTAVHFSIDPERNTLTRARFAADNLAGLLGKYKLDLQ